MASLENAAIILRLINTLHRKVTVTDLVEHLEMPKSSASRLLAQMKDLGLLEREESTRAYGPGVIILELSRLVRETTTLSAQMQDALKRLSAQSGHTGYISVLEGRDIMVLHVQHHDVPALQHRDVAGMAALGAEPFQGVLHLGRQRGGFAHQARQFKNDDARPIGAGAFLAFEQPQVLHLRQQARRRAFRHLEMLDQIGHRDLAMQRVDQAKDDGGVFE